MAHRTRPGGPRRRKVLGDSCTTEIGSVHRTANPVIRSGYPGSVRCPACDDARLDKHGNCHTCGGVWLPEKLVRDRLASSPAVTGGGYSERHCPVCDKTMDKPLIFNIP